MGTILDQHHQSQVSGVTPMPVDRIDDTNTVSTSSAEAVVWYYSNSGVWAAASGQAAGTMCVAKLTYTGVLNSNASALGKKKDTSFSFAAATRAATLVEIPESEFSLMLDMTVAEKVVHVATWLTTNGYYAVDHRRGEVWLLTKADPTNDAATYKYATPSVSTSGSTVDITAIGGTAVAVDDSAMAATPPFLPVGGEYRSSATTYADGDATVLQTDVNGHLKCAISSDIEIGAVELKDGTTDARQAVKVDNATASATPTIALIGGIYKDALDTYADNDAVPNHYDVNGLLKTTETPSASAESAPTAFRSTTLDETASVAVKASAGNVYGWNLYNPNSYDVFVKFYNTAQGSTTVGTTAVVETVQVPSLGSVVMKESTPIKSFSTAITIAATKLVADADTTAIALDVFTHIYYK